MADTPDLTLEEFKKRLEQATKNQAKPAGEATTQEDINIEKDIDQIVKDLGEGIKEAQDLLGDSSKDLQTEIQEIIENLKKLKTTTNEDNKTKKQLITDTKRVQKLLKDEINIRNKNNRLASSSVPLNTKPGGLGNPPTPPPSPPDPTSTVTKVDTILTGTIETKGGKSVEVGGESIENAAAKLKEEGLKKYRSTVAGQIADYTNLIIGSRNIFQAAFRGSFNDATVFRKEMRRVAYQVDGISASAREMQSEFADLGKSIVAQTGVPLEETQEAYLRNIKKGVLAIGSENKMRKDGLRVIKSGLHMSTMIGSDAQQTADMFGDWYRTLGLSSDKMSRLAIDSKNIARSTGLTGNELLEAMKSSEKILQNLKNQGNLTSEAMQNVITTAAEAKKLGVEDSNSRLLDAMTSTNKLFFEADSKIKGYMLRVGAGLGKQNEMMSGRFTQSAGNMKKMSEMMAGDLSRLSDGLINNIDNIEDQLAGLSGEQLTRLSVGVKSLTGMEIDEFVRNAKAFEKGGRGLNGTLEDLDKIMKSSVSTVNEKRKAEKDYSEAIMSAGLSSIAGAKEATGPDKGKSLSGYFEEMKGGQLETFNANAEAIAKSLGKSTTGMDQQEKFLMMSTNAAQKLEEAAKAQGIKTEDFSSQLENAVKSGDEKKYREIASRMEDVQKEVGIKEAKAVDPIIELGHKIEKTNEYLRRIVGGVFGRLIDAFGSTGLGLALLGSNLAALAFVYQGTLTKFAGMFKPFIWGFARAQKANKGFLKSLEMGAALQSRAISKNFKRSNTVGQVSKRFTQAKESINLFKNTKIIPGLDMIETKGSIAIDKIASHLDDLAGRGKNAIGKFFGHFTKGFNRARRSGDDFIIATIRGLRGQFISNMNSAFKIIKSGFFKVIGIIKSGFFKVIGKIKSGFSLARASVGGFLSTTMSRLSSFPKILDLMMVGLRAVRTAGGAAFSLIAKGWQTFRATSGTALSSISKFFKSFGKKAGMSRTRSIYEGVKGHLKSGATALKSTPLAKTVMASDTFKNISAFVTKGMSKIKDVYKGGFKGLAASTKVGLKAGIGLLKKAGPVAIVFAAIDGIMGAFNGFYKTGDRFSGVLKAMGKSTQDLTWGMYASSTVAGALVGILDGLTFGLLGLSGAGAYLETYLTMSLYAIFAVVEGVVDGITAAFTMVWSALSYVGQQFSGIGNSVIKVFNSIAGIFGGSVSDMSDVLAAVYKPLKLIGVALGLIVGLPIAAVIWVIVKAISLLIVPFEMLGALIAGIVDIIAAVLTPARWGSLGTIIWDAIYGIFKPIGSFLWSLGVDLMAPFYWLYDKLIGHSVIPDLVLGVLKWVTKMALGVLVWFAKLPFMILYGLAKLNLGILNWAAQMALGALVWFAKINIWFAKLPFMILYGLAKLPFMIINLLVKGLMALPGMLVNSIINGVTSLMQMIPSAIYNALHSAASAVGLGWLVEKVGGGGGGGEGESIADKVSAGVSSAIEAAKGLWQGAKGVASNLYQGAKGVASKAIDYHPMNLAVKGASKLMQSGPAIWDGVKSFFGFGKDKAAEASQSLDNGLANQTYDKHAIPTAMPTSVQPTTGEAQPVHLGDVGQTILREKAGTAGNKLQSDELARMEEASNQQVSELEQIRQGIEELVALMKPRGGGGGLAGESNQRIGSTKDFSSPRSSAIFGKMTSGKIVSGANKGIINTGPTN